MRPRLVQYEVPGWGIGELWLEGDLVVHCDHPVARPRAGSTAAGCDLADRLTRWFAGEPDDFLDVRLDVDEDGFYAECTRILRALPRGQTITYGELAERAGRPRAARAAGTFCARNRFAVFVPCHRVVGADGLGSYGSLGLDYKRRLLRIDGVAL